MTASSTKTTGMSDDEILQRSRELVFGVAAADLDDGAALMADYYATLGEVIGLHEKILAAREPERTAIIRDGFDLARFQGEFEYYKGFQTRSGQPEALILRASVRRQSGVGGPKPTKAELRAEEDTMFLGEDTPEMQCLRTAARRLNFLLGEELAQ
jgi:hypothetical protein